MKENKIKSMTNLKSSIFYKFTNFVISSFMNLAKNHNTIWIWTVTQNEVMQPNVLKRLKKEAPT